jgi:heat shock protein HslJ
MRPDHPVLNTLFRIVGTSIKIMQRTVSIRLINLRNKQRLMHEKYVPIALLLTLCVLFAGCTFPLPKFSSGSTELMRSSWSMVSYYDTGNQTMVPVGPGSNITLKFSEDGNVSGLIDGCRKYTGRYTTIGETIRVTNLTGADEDACPLSEESAVMENIYFSLLQKSPRFDINVIRVF